jgi:hypothetical protein
MLLIGGLIVASRLAAVYFCPREALPKQESLCPATVFPAVHVLAVFHQCRVIDR